MTALFPAVALALAGPAAPVCPPGDAKGAPAQDGAASGEVAPGRATRSAVEALPDWAAAGKGARPEAAGTRALLGVKPGGTVRVYFGTWCSDSRRELARLWKALDEARAPLPFAVELIAVDRNKAAPGGLTEGVGLRYVPTFVVLRGGKEIGRVVESAPAGIEKDLAALLRGERSGVLSGRPDLGR